jgi:hypothetical protein
MMDTQHWLAQEAIYMEEMGLILLPTIPIKVLAVVLDITVVVAA